MSVNTPVSVWRDTQGLSEYSNSGVYNIVDTTATFLVDPSGVFIVDTGVLATIIPSTIWSENESR